MAGCPWTLCEVGARSVLLLPLSLAAVGFLIYQGQALSHPYPLDYGEAPLVDQAMRLAAGRNIYRLDISSPPHTISNYPPPYVLSLVPFVKVFGSNFLAGRVISSLCSLASGAFLALIVYAHTTDRTAAIVTANVNECDFELRSRGETGIMAGNLYAANRRLRE